jgi:AmmeMemoRadiSam system protein B
MQTIEEPLAPIDTAHVRALVSPHIDYPRGGPIYAQVWQAASEAIRAAERVIIFGTDHMGGEGRLTLTRQSYGTPWGDFPTDLEAVDAVATTIGEEAAFGEELHHLGEHSIELALVWLHYIRRGVPCRLVPILCGSFESFVSGEANPAQSAVFTGALRALRQVVASGPTLVVAAADLAHVGQAFGDLLPVDFVARMPLRTADERIIAQICRGSADGFFAEIQQVEDKFHVCGLPPIYLMLRLLSKSIGQPAGYLHCPADEREQSWVSICGVTLQ